MKQLTIDPQLSFKEISTLINANLEDGEKIMADCLAENSNIVLTRLVGGFALGLTFELAGSTPEFKVVATDRNLFIIGYDHTKNKIKGGFEFQYNEIDSLTLKKDAIKADIKFASGEKFTLKSMEFTDKPELIERTQKTFKYIASVIDSSKVINK